MDDIKMLIQESHKESNGISKGDDAQLISFDPRPQRVLRLNRRGFYLSTHSIQNGKLTSDETSPGKVNHCQRSSEVSHLDKLKSLSLQKVIKLSTSKNNSLGEIQNGRKRNSSETTSSDTNQDSQETPPKKKHKPITWP